MPTTIDAKLIDNLPPNVARMFLERVAASGSAEAFRFPVGDQWESRTWQQTSDEVHDIAAGLLALGVEPEQRVAIACSTRYEWILADLATMCAGAATTTVYPSTMADDVAYILADSDSVVVFAEDDTQVDKLRQTRAEIPGVSHVIVVAARTHRRRRRRRLGDVAAAAAAGRARLPGRAPGRHRGTRRRDRARQPGHAHLHVRHDRPPEGGAAAAQRVDVRG